MVAVGSGLNRIPYKGSGLGSIAQVHTLGGMAPCSVILLLPLGERQSNFILMTPQPPIGKR